MLLLQTATLLSSILTTTVTSVPHEGHHGYHEPGSELKSTTISSSNGSAPARPAHPHPPSGHSHSHKGAPLETLNETQVLEGHAPDPLSYLAFDLYGERQGYKSGWGDEAFDVVVYPAQLKGHGWTMTWHIILMCLAFFGALPATIALRASRHPLHPVAHVSFFLLAVLGWILGSSYKKHTPDLYEGSSHGTTGTLTLLVVIVIFTIERIASIKRVLTFVQSSSERRGGRVKWHEVWKGVRGDDEDEHDQPERGMLLEDQAGFNSAEVVENAEEGQWANQPEEREHDGRRRSHVRTFSIDSAASTLHNSPTGSSSSGAGHQHALSFGSLRSYIPLPHDIDPYAAVPSPARRRTIAERIRGWARIATLVAEVAMVLLGYMNLLIGTTVYLGGCRDAYLNGCLAHLIKGSIFFLYGLITFARYLGAWSSFGWAWSSWSPPPSPSTQHSSNFISSKRKSRSTSGEYSPVETHSPTRSPSLPTLSTCKRPPSPEMIESWVILFYGATNTWMERFGAEAGSPYTAKQIQHISIAVMYFFAGCLGVALELGYLSRPTRPSPKPGDANTYKPSYNPFAALAIGITGIAMAVHHQTYVFQVSIHVLWGTLLALYAPTRILSYTLMWIRKPEERETGGAPPTEAISAFFLASGGVAFISSTEQIGFWAMRSQRDDVMMFANAIVAIVFFCFTWVFGIIAIKTWADSRHSSRRKQSERRKRVSFDEHEHVEEQDRYELQGRPSSSA